jgi:hypothetical protein
MNPGISSPLVKSMVVMFEAAPARSRELKQQRIEAAQ